MINRAATAAAIRIAVESEPGEWTPSALADDLDVSVDDLLSIVASELRAHVHVERMHAANAFRLVRGPAPHRGLTDLSDLERRILAGLGDHGGLTAWELARAIGADPRNVRRAMTRLVAEGWIDTTVVRRYRCVSVRGRAPSPRPIGVERVQLALFGGGA